MVLGSYRLLLLYIIYFISVIKHVRKLFTLKKTVVTIIYVQHIFWYDVLKKLKHRRPSPNPFTTDNTDVLYDEQLHTAIRLTLHLSDQ